MGWTRAWSPSARCGADAEASDPLDREHVLRYIFKRPEVFSIELDMCLIPLSGIESFQELIF